MTLVTCTLELGTIPCLGNLKLTFKFENIIFEIFYLEQILQSNHVGEECWGVTDHRAESVLDKVTLLTESPGCHLTEQFLNINQVSRLEYYWALAGKEPFGIQSQSISVFLPVD